MTARKRWAAEQIMGSLREAEVLLSQVQDAAELGRRIIPVAGAGAAE